MATKTIQSLHDALAAVLAIDPKARYRFVNHGSGTYSLDLQIDPAKVTEEDFEKLDAHGVWEESDEGSSHEERVRELGLNLVDEYPEYLQEQEARAAEEHRRKRR